MKKRRDVSWIDDQVILLAQRYKQTFGIPPTPVNLRALRCLVIEGETEIVLPMMQKDMRNE